MPKFESVEDFIKKHLRFQQHWNKKVITMQDAKWQPLKEDTYLDGIVYAKNSEFKVFETTNFGWIVFAPTALDSRDLIPGKRIIKY